MVRDHGLGLRDRRAADAVAARKDDRASAIRSATGAMIFYVMCGTLVVVLAVLSALLVVLSRRAR